MAATPYKQIRASYDDETITVYQAYNRTIASAAVEKQQLDASPAFRTSRMTWIKPSWAWMLYRAGYSYKDPGQERILALKMKHADFIWLLEQGVLSSAGSTSSRSPTAENAPSEVELEGGTSGTTTKMQEQKQKLPGVRIQWDPERTVRLEKLPYRSIQIGIPAALSERWARELVVSIEDVTQRARDLKRVLDERPEVTEQELVEMGLVPVERPFEIPKGSEAAVRLGMVD
ncbi:hypothetical protein N656DRAFT_794492 [Canariomyces notabilis]|uniref:ATP-dependent RNA helicase DHX8 n=1 Tax=Canariomyces notabilis TaxID=2074819 RepID=A0AAN6TKK9_9PEZI|nr:hypothetical protein N656DRAFT_794492 [Canariomyces arenarius]